MESCPNCQSKKFVKNGSVRGKKRYKCKKCGYTFTQSHPYYKYSLRKKQMFVRRFLTGETLRSIEDTQIKKYKNRPSNVAMVYWLKRLDKLIKNPADAKEKCHFNPQDTKKFQELIDFLGGRSLGKVKKAERKKVGFQYVYIIFKLMDVIFPDKKIIKKKISVEEHKSEEPNAEDGYLE